MEFDHLFSESEEEEVASPFVVSVPSMTQQQPQQQPPQPPQQPQPPPQSSPRWKSRKEDPMLVDSVDAAVVPVNTHSSLSLPLPSMPTARHAQPQSQPPQQQRGPSASSVSSSATTGHVSRRNPTNNNGTVAAATANTTAWLPSGLVYDVRMMAHNTLSEEDRDHPECPERLRRIYEALRDAGYLFQFKRIKARLATSEEVLYFHRVAYHQQIQKTETMSAQELVALASDYNSIYLNGSSAFCALLSCGGLLSLVEAIWLGRARNGFALIRPPGHHAEANEAMGFCIYNNVVVAARYLQKKCGAGRVLIVDWDVHHGNGTQQAFYEDPSVMYVSIHRFDDGNFYPHSEEANYTCIGAGAAKGSNINIPWPYGGFGDADYLYMFQQILMPIAYEFNPDFVIVSCGFDAALGDPIGSCRVTPAGFSQMTYLLSGLAAGKIVLALEGGYNLASISVSAAACAKVLLGHQPDRIPESMCPSAESVELAAKIVAVLAPYWKCLRPLATVVPEHVRKGMMIMSGEDTLDYGQSVSLEDVMLQYRDQVLHDQFKALAVANTIDRFTGKMYWSSFATPTAVLFLHDGPFFPFHANAAETILDPTQSRMVDASLPYLRYFYDQKWSFVDLMMPEYELKQQSLGRYPDLRKQHRNGDEKNLEALERTLLRLFDLLLENPKTKRISIVAAGSTVHAVPELLLRRKVEQQSGCKLVLLCSQQHPVPVLRGAEASPAKMDWFRKNTVVYMSNAEIPEGKSFALNPRAPKCISTGSWTTAGQALWKYRAEVMQYLT